jgi:hypothetical protein
MCRTATCLEPSALADGLSSYFMLVENKRGNYSFLKGTANQIGHLQRQPVHLFVALGEKLGQLQFVQWTTGCIQTRIR